MTVKGKEMAIFTGTAGHDSRNGTSANDDFFLQQGGSDLALGGSGADRFYFGQAWDYDDLVDGGTGSDALILQGDYSLLYGLGDMTGVEKLTLLSGSDTSF